MTALHRALQHGQAHRQKRVRRRGRLPWTRADLRDLTTPSPAARLACERLGIVLDHMTIDTSRELRDAST